MNAAPAYRVGVVGATGAVGSTVLEVLAERGFPASEVVPFASERSAGRRLPFAGGEIECRTLSDESIQGLDLVISSAGGKVSAEWAPRLVDAGAVVVDNTSYWRMHDDVPLVIAEVNPDALAGHQRADREPELLDDADGRGAEADLGLGRDRAPRDLHLPVGLRHGPERRRGAARPVARRARGRDREAPDVYPHPIAFNVLPQVEVFEPGDDYTTEERKLMAETRKILSAGEGLGISATCARVPVFVGHSQSVNVQTRDALSPDECRELLSAAPGVVVVDDPADGVYPLATAAAGRDDVQVGRIRLDPSHERCLNLWIVGDNLRKGAATNAVQLAELLHARGLIQPVQAPAFA